MKLTQLHRRKIKFLLVESVREVVLEVPVDGSKEEAIVCLPSIMASVSKDQAFLTHTNVGSGVDNVLQMTIVIAIGSHLIVNAYNNPDLFWVLRGGVGGAFGVLASVTYCSHPSTPFTGCLFIANRTELNYANPKTSPLSSFVRPPP